MMASRDLKVLVTGDASGLRRAFSQVNRDTKEVESSVTRMQAKIRSKFNEAGHDVQHVGRDLSKHALGIAAGFTSIAGAAAAVEDSVATVENLAKGTALLSRTTGFDTKTSSEWVQVAKLRGVQAQQLNMGFVTLSKQMTAAAEGSTKSAEAFHKLGISQEAVKRGDINEILHRSADAFERLPAGANKAALAQQLFGRQSRTLLQLLNEGSKGLDENLHMVDQYGAALDKGGIEKAKQMIEQQHKMELAFEGIKITLGTALLPVLADGAKKIAEFVKGMRDGTGAGGKFAGALDSIWQKAKPVVEFLKDHPKMIAIAVGAWATYKAAMVAATALNSGRTLIGAMKRLVPMAAAEGTAAGEAYSAGFSRTAGAGGAAGAGRVAVGAGAAGAASRIPGSLGVAGAAGGLLGGVAALKIGTDFLRGYAKADAAVKVFQDRVHALVASGDREGLRKLSGEIRHYADVNEGAFSDSGKAAHQYADQVEHALDRANRAGQDSSRQLGGVTRDISNNWRLLEGNTKSHLQDIKDAVKANMGVVKLRLGTDSEDGRKALAANFRQAADDVRTQMTRGAVSTQTGTRQIRAYLISALKALGLTGEQASNKVDHGTTGQPGNLNKGVPRMPAATGGWIGQRGQAGGDNIPIVVGAGEAVLNRHQQAIVEGLLGDGFLDKLFTSVQTPHYMARGGYVPQPRMAFAVGGRIPRVAVRDDLGAVSSLAQRAVDIDRTEALRIYARHAAATSAAPSGGSAAPSGIVKTWLSRALRITGHYSPANLAALFSRTMQESGGNPRAINLWDSNAKAGHPSKGLIQTIDSTFASYQMPGHGDIWNPVDNAIAAIRYMYATYGHIVGSSSTGYSRGGRVGKHKHHADPFGGGISDGGSPPVGDPGHPVSSPGTVSTTGLGVPGSGLYDQQIASADFIDSGGDPAAIGLPPGTTGDSVRRAAISHRIRVLKRQLRKRITRATRTAIIGELASLGGDLQGLNAPADTSGNGSGGGTGEDPNQPLIDALNAQTQAALDLKAAQDALHDQMAADLKFKTQLFGTQTGVVLAAIADMVSGQIGGRTGLGVQTPAFAGSRARY